MHDPVATLTAAFALYAAAGVVCLLVLFWRDRDEILRLPEQYQKAHPLDPPMSATASALALCLALVAGFCLLLPIVVLTWPFLGGGGRGGRP